MNNGQGRMNGKTHTLPVRVYYEDTDAGGVVYYANYLRFLERARTEMLQSLSPLVHEGLAEQGLAFAVRSCALEYLAPALLHQWLEVESTVTRLGGSSLAMRQVVRHEGRDLVTAEVVLVCIKTAQIKAGRIPEELRSVLKEVVV